MATGRRNSFAKPTLLVSVRFAREIKRKSARDSDSKVGMAALATLQIPQMTKQTEAQTPQKVQRYAGLNTVPEEQAAPSCMSFGQDVSCLAAQADSVLKYLDAGNLRGERSTDQETCRTLQEPVDEDNVHKARSDPHALFCSLCMKRLTRCSCARPLLFTPHCRVCEATIEDCTCPPGIQDRVDEANSVGTDESCTICHRISDQERLVECDGKGCGRMFHHGTCGSQIKAPDDDVAWLCEICMKEDNALTDGDTNSDGSKSDSDAGCVPVSATEAMELLTQEREKRQRILDSAMHNAETSTGLAEESPEKQQLVLASRGALQRLHQACS